LSESTADIDAPKESANQGKKDISINASKASKIADGSNQFDQKGLVQVVKTAHKNYMGVPTKIASILGKIESIACGDQNSYAIVKI